MPVRCISLFRRQGEGGQATEKDDENPTGNRAPSCEPRRSRRRTKFHPATPRTNLNSKIIMLMPARTISDILSQNTQLVKYSDALPMNRSEPAITATMKAAQVNGRT